MTSHVDLPLARRLERAQVSRIEALARMAAERLPAVGAARISIAGGCAVFVAPHVSTSRAAGLGMTGPVQAADVEALERFYRERETEARILVSPFADPSLFEHLGERGFRLSDLDTVLYRRLDGADEHAGAAPRGVAVHRVGPDDSAAWVCASLTGFAPEGKEPALGLSPIYETLFHDPTFTFLTATAGGTLAATASVQVHESTAHFFADSTLAEHRGRGAQHALIAARLTLAREAGCDLALAVTAPGGPSQRNYERAGFAVAYSLALMVKRFDREQSAADRLRLQEAVDQAERELGAGEYVVDDE